MVPSQSYTLFLDVFAQMYSFLLSFLPPSPTSSLPVGHLRPVQFLLLKNAYMHTLPNRTLNLVAVLCRQRMVKSKKQTQVKNIAFLMQLHLQDYSFTELILNTIFILHTWSPAFNNWHTKTSAYFQPFFININSYSIHFSINKVLKILEYKKRKTGTRTVVW